MSPNQLSRLKHSQSSSSINEHYISGQVEEETDDELKIEELSEPQKASHEEPGQLKSMFDTNGFESNSLKNSI